MPGSGSGSGCGGLSVATPEGRIKDQVKIAIKKAFPDSYRFMPVQIGMGDPGLDFFYCINGLFVAIETKTPGNKLAARQEYTAELIGKAGGLVFVVRDDIDLRRMMERLHDETQPVDGTREDTR
jgi:hypothetical protein